MAFLLGMLLLTLIILRPFIIIILGSIIIAFILYPIYNIVLKKIKKENLSAFIVSFVIIVLMASLSLILVNTIRGEISDVYSYLNVQLSENQDLISINCQRDNILCRSINHINDDPRYKAYTGLAIKNIASKLSLETSSFLFSLPMIIVNIIVLVFLTFFLLKKGKKIWEDITELIPLKESHKTRLLKKVNYTMKGIVFGYFVVSIMAGIVGWIAFQIVGINIALILGILIMIAAFLPALGTGIVWLPVALAYFFDKMPFKAIIIIIAGIIIFLLDSFVRAKLIGDRINIHPLIVLFGVLSGALTFGIVGIFIGPLILSLLTTTVEIYQEEKESLIQS